jgi:hypothetical protein
MEIPGGGHGSSPSAGCTTWVRKYNIRQSLRCGRCRCIGYGRDVRVGRSRGRGRCGGGLDDDGAGGRCGYTRAVGGGVIDVVGRGLGRVELC